MTLAARDRRVLGRDRPPQPLEIVRTKDSYAYDAKGTRYIDFYAGWCVGNFGWGRKQIETAIRKSRRPDYVPPGYLYKPWVELAELLGEITPGKLKVSFRANGGTEAVEQALQIAMSATGRHKFLSIEGSYHGNSLGALSIGASEERDRFENLLPGCQKLSPPLDAKAAAKAETILKRRDVAAFIMEPIICNLGVMVPEREFMQRMQALCRKYRTLFIADEIATGFGRTGKVFASEHFELEPDMMCLGKAMAGGYAPIGATIVTKAVAEALGEDFSFYSTYAWHPVGVDAAIASIRYLMKTRDSLLAHVKDLSTYFQTRFSSIDFGVPVPRRIKGLAIGLQFKDEETATRLRDRCRRKGLLISAEDEVAMLLPALTIDRKTAKRGLDILESCVPL